MAATDLPCPFCSKRMPNRAGLASHIRSAHAKSYAKWRNQSHSHNAAKPPAPARVQVASAPEPAPIANLKVREKASIAPQDPTLALLNKAYKQLNERKQAVEEQLQRFDDLRKELEAIDVQIESLETTLGVFGANNAPPQAPPDTDEATSAPPAAEPVKEKGTAKAAKADEEPEFTGNKREFVKQLVKTSGTSGITPTEIDRILTDHKIPRGKNLIYNALSILVKQGSMRRKDGRYFTA